MSNSRKIIAVTIVAIGESVCLRLSSLAADDNFATERPAPSTLSGTNVSRGGDEEMISLGRKDLKEGLAFIESHYGEEDRLAARVRLLRALCQERLDLIPKMIELLPLQPTYLPNGFTVDADSMMQSVSNFWVQKQPEAIIQYAEELPDDRPKRLLIPRLAESLTEANRFSDATRLLGKMLPARPSMNVLANIAAQFRGADKTELFTWVASLDGRVKPMLFLHLATRYGSLQDEESLQKLIAFAPDMVRPGILEELGRMGAKVRGEKTTAWIKSLSFAPEERAHILAGALTGVSNDQIVPMVEAVFAEGDTSAKRSAARTYIYRLFTLDREKAIAWVKAVPPDLHSDAIRYLVMDWFNVDAKGALAWAKALDRGPDRDLALSVYVDLLGKTDPTLARVLAEDIDDGAIKKEVLLYLRGR
ncbi:MAG: hypothetical protein ACAI37_13460 [Chthoniobacter sp.]